MWVLPSAVITEKLVYIVCKYSRIANRIIHKQKRPPRERSFHVILLGVFSYSHLYSSRFDFWCQVLYSIQASDSYPTGRKVRTHPVYRRMVAGNTRLEKSKRCEQWRWIRKVKTSHADEFCGNTEVKRLNPYLCASPCPLHAEVTQRIVWQQTIKINDYRQQNPAYRCTIYEKEHQKVFFFFFILFCSFLDNTKKKNFYQKLVK